MEEIEKRGIWGSRCSSSLSLSLSLFLDIEIGARNDDNNNNNDSFESKNTLNAEVNMNIYLLACLPTYVATYLPSSFLVSSSLDIIIVVFSVIL